MITAFAAEEQAQQAAGQGGPIALIMSFLPMILIILVFYFIIIRPQKKQQKQLRLMLDALQVGDKIVTVGGIIGKIVKIKEDEVVIETGTGAEKCQIKFQKAAISTNLTVHE
ncbi:MAG: preprotein translocase subunit YajC [Ruminococcaceae bacterium]|nr:preprotein translocase subunit YajC [Oscillospiraceae bacterium]